MKQFNQEVTAGTGFSKLTNVTKKLFHLTGVEESGLTGQQLDYSARLLIQLSQSLMHSVDLQTEFVQSLCKFSYLSQRVFLYLIYQGFCG